MTLVNHACAFRVCVHRVWICFARVVFVWLIAAASPLRGADVSGEQVYKSHCAACHDQPGATRAPSIAALKKLPATRILKTLDFGLMMGVAYPLKRDEREAVAKFLGTSEVEAPLPASAFCPSGQHPLSRVVSPVASGAASTVASVVASGAPSAVAPEVASKSWNGWSPSPSNSRYQTAEQAGLTAAQVSHLKLKWAFGFPGDVTAFGAPTVLNGTLFVGSAGGAVQALDAKTGCVYWVFQANGPVRGAILGIPNGGSYSLLVADQIGWVYSLDAKTGRALWKRRVEDHEAARLTGSPVAADGVVFIPASSWEESRATDPHYECCTFRGSITALRASDGSPVWKTYLVDAAKKTGRVNSAGAVQWGPSGAPVWSAPTVDAKRGVLYITTGDNYSAPTTATSDAVMALQIKTGKILWTQQTYSNDAYTSACRDQGANCPAEDGPDYDFGSSAIMVHTTAGRDLLIAGQKSGMVYGLDPEQHGKILWQTRVGKGGRNGGVQWGMTSDANAVYAAVSDMAGTLNFNGPVGGANFDPTQGGGLTALRVEDGSQIWFSKPEPCPPHRPGCSPAQSAALTMIPGVVFSGSVDGHLRAFSAENARVLWDFDTAKEYSAVDRVPARGGSLDGAGPVIAGGMLFVNSGYPRTGGMPGNVLLAFAPDE